ncbi:MAG: Fe-S cluster assembly protein SufD [Gammaproteobacteria bacterium]|jgi:Fe-S cluster assembly protein SufD
MTMAAQRGSDRKLSRAEASFHDAWQATERGTDPISNLQRAGFAEFEASGLPSTRVESWKYTALRTLSRRAFRVSGPVGAPTAEIVEGMAIEGLEGPRLVFLNGRLQQALSGSEDLDGLGIYSLSDAVSDGLGAAAEILGQIADPAAHPFAALNQAFLEDGVVITVAPGKTIAKPLYLLFISCPGGDPIAAQPRIVVDAGAQSHLCLVEHYTGIDEPDNLTNAVTEIRGGAGSRVEHYRLQEEPAQAFHIGGLHARLQRDASLDSHNIQVGAALARLDIGVSLEEPGAELRLNGLYTVDGKRHVDNHTRVDHLAPETRSDELYRGIVDDRGRAVFNGKAVVHKDAQRIDAHQSNKNLLLSQQAEVDTKPELEIYADDVKCSHGATVGQLDKNALFYLLSRGIGEEVARKLLTYAFAEVVAARMPLEVVRRRLEKRIAGTLPESDLIREPVGGDR